MINLDSRWPPAGSEFVSGSRLPPDRRSDPLREERPDASGSAGALSAGSIREYGFTNPVLVVGENGIIADNKRAEQAGWDRELLALEFGDLQDAAVDLTSLGFDAAELEVSRS